MDAQELSDRRKRVAELLDAEKVGLIKGIVQNGHLMLRSDLDISCDVGAQGDVLSVLQSFNSDYLRLVLEAILRITIESTDELQFMDNLNTIATKRIFHSPGIVKNKKYVYTLGNWLTDEGKKAVARHFLNVLCQILYLMEQCLQNRVIPGSEMFKRDSSFHSINDIFGFISRELISGKTLLPKVMETIGFKPTYHWVGDDEHNQSRRSVSPHRSFVAHSRKISEFVPTKAKKVVIRDETQEDSNIAERTLVPKRELIRKEESELTILRRKLLETEAERDQYLMECQELKEKIIEDEARYQKQLEGRPTERSELLTRVQQRIDEEANDSKVQTLFNLMDQTDGTSFLLNQTQETATNLEKHAKKLSAYQSNIVALYEQLKQTAKFLTDIIHSLGMDDAQTELLMQKINKLRLDMQESNEVSEQVVNETQKLAAELTEMSILIEESLRVSVLNPAQSSFVDNSHNNKASEELTAKNTELTQKIEELTAEMAELEQRLFIVQEARDKFESQVTASSKDKKELLEKYTNAMKLVEARDDELKNRENIISELQSVASKKVDLPVGLEKDIQAQLGKIYTTLSDVTNKVHK